MTSQTNNRDNCVSDEADADSNDPADDARNSTSTPPPSYQSACADGAGEILGIGVTQSEDSTKHSRYDDEPPPYMEALSPQSVQHPVNLTCLISGDSSVLERDSTGNNAFDANTTSGQYNRQYTQNAHLSYHPQSLTTYYPPQTFGTSGTLLQPATGLRQTQQSPYRLDFRPLIPAQLTMDRVDTAGDGSTEAHTSAYFAISLCTCFFCNPVFGLLALFCSCAALLAELRGEVSRAKSCGNHAIGCCVCGIIFTAAFLVYTASRR